MTFLAGLGLGFSLIVAIGAQNVFVLRQGIRREHVLLVATICTLSDAVLIAVGVVGVRVATAAQPWLLGAVRWAGALFLAGYGLLAARRSLRRADRGLAVAEESAARVHARLVEPTAGAAATLVVTRSATSPASVALTCLALTWLNPHVYLDTVFLVGSVAGAQGERRWEFAAGAMLASVAWFFALALGSRLLSGILASARSWQVVDGIIAVVMAGLAVALVVT